MRKKIAKMISLILIIMLMGTSAAFASEAVITNSIMTEDGETILQPRSLYLAAASSQITNEGSGVLSIYADFTSHTGVEWGSITITLYRRKSLDSGSWSKVDTYTKEFDGADYSNGKITYAYTEFDVRGLSTNYYYYIVCSHKVKTPSGYETKTTQTDAVLLTPYPDFRRIDE